MEYRVLPHGGEKIGILGMGTSSIGMAGESEIIDTLEFALRNGVNYFDMASSDAVPFSVFGKTFENVRSDVYYQVHFGADYSTGKYGWTTDIEAVKRSVDWQLDKLKTDYIDFGFIHCIDELSDLKKVTENGLIDYIIGLKNQGVVRHIGLSSHTPEVAQRVLDMGIIDMLMFSINPGYDYNKGEYAIGSADERMRLYRRCERDGVGISVMKAFSGGQLLNADTSPFGKALTENQCIQYALDKPGVITVLAGVRGKEDLKRVLNYLNANAEERDYSVIGSFVPKSYTGACVYCNHCQPCPAGIDIGLINKYYDLSKSGDEMAAVHYNTLEKRADDCTACGHCNRRCPFHVNQVERMAEINDYFKNK